MSAYHARISIARSDHPDDRARHHPMRATAARVALASALADMDEPEEACSVASEAFQAPFLIEELFGRVEALLRRLRARHAPAPAVLRLADEYQAARSILPRGASP
jgi:DNA-binding response OmpR family regulator